MSEESGTRIVYLPMSKIVYGARYEQTKNLTRAQVAKCIRQDIKAAVAIGELPKARYSVTCRSYAGGGSIDVYVSFVEKPGFRLANPLRLAWDASHPHRPLADAPSEVMWRNSEEARDLLGKVEAIVAAYNFDGSEP